MGGCTREGIEVRGRTRRRPAKVVRMPRQQLLSELSDHLPDAVDQFTPDGRLPTHEEVSSRWADR
jgi:uncharacterized protein YidB (DUF937 family)